MTTFEECVSKARTVSYEPRTDRFDAYSVPTTARGPVMLPPAKGRYALIAVATFALRVATAVADAALVDEYVTKESVMHAPLSEDRFARPAMVALPVTARAVTDMASKAPVC